MSIKIYSGYRLRLKGMLLTTFANEVRAFMQPLLEESLLSSLGQEAVTIYLRRSLSAEGLLPDQGQSDISSWSVAVQGIDDYLKEMHEFSLILYTDPKDTLGEWVYLTVYGANEWEDQFSNHFTGSHGLETFAYWNNTDMPEETTEAEWEERKSVWKRIGIMDTAPVACGLSVEMFTKRWYKTKPVLATWDGNTEMETVFERIISAPQILERCSANLAVDVDAYQYFPQEEKIPSHQIIAFMFDKSRDESRALLTQQIKRTLTRMPSWEEVCSRPPA